MRKREKMNSIKCSYRKLRKKFKKKSLNKIIGDRKKNKGSDRFF